jgi:hypothetical protein
MFLVSRVSVSSVSRHHTYPEGLEKRGGAANFKKYVPWLSFSDAFAAHIRMFIQFNADILIQQTFTWIAGPNWRGVQGIVRKGWKEGSKI